MEPLINPTKITKNSIQTLTTKYSIQPESKTFVIL